MLRGKGLVGRVVKGMVSRDPILVWRVFLSKYEKVLTMICT